jgi:MoaA/NifB/PqqE/SkfB family radical SAM enzyme
MNEQELINNLYKKFQTTMIGALARFEDNFGYVWENEPEDSKLWDRWEYTRNSILNNGNKQARAAIEEVKKYVYKNSISQKYNYKINFKKEKDL